MKQGYTEWRRRERVKSHRAGHIYQCDLRRDGYDLLATAVTLRYNPINHSNDQPKNGVSPLGNMLGFLAAAGNVLFNIVLLLAFLAFSGYVVYRFRKATISTIHIVSELVILGLFLTPCVALGAAAGQYLDTLLQINSTFTAVCAFLGVIAGFYSWNQLR